MAVIGLAAMGAAAIAIGGAAASASSEPHLVINGDQALDGATVAPSGTVEVRGGAPDSVTFVLDGVFLAKDATAPFVLTISAASGTHTLKARVETGGARETLQADFTVTAALGTPAPVAPSPVAPAPTASAGAVVPVATAAQLTLALKAAKPGQTIRLADGAYAGSFTAAASGTAAAPIRLIGGRGAILSGPSTSKGTTLMLAGASYWSLEGFSVSGGQKGVMIDGASHVTVDGLDVGRVGMEAIHLRNFTSDSVVRNCTVHDTGLSKPQYGEGIYIGSAQSNWSSVSGGRPDASDRNLVAGNTILRTTAEPIDVKEGSSGGSIVDNALDGSGISGANYADSFIDVKGNGYTIARNTMSSPSGSTVDGMQTHEVVDGWGTRTIFSANVLRGAVAGYAINVVSDGNTVHCDNIRGSAAKGLTNIACS